MQYISHSSKLVERYITSKHFQVDVSGENGEIFPKRICQCCVDLFRYGIAVQVKDAEGKTINKMTLFNLVKSLFISMR